MAATLSGHLILVFAVYAYLTAGIATRRRSAVWIYVPLDGIGLVLSPPAIEELEGQPMAVALKLMQVVAQTVSLGLLFTTTARSWQAIAPDAVPSGRP